MDQPAQALDCMCKHPERYHHWTALENTGLIHIGRCSFMSYAPRPDNEPNPYYKFCDCSAYMPDKSKLKDIK